MALSRASMAFVGLVLAGLVVLIIMSATSSPTSSPPAAGAQPSASGTPFRTDDRGFVNSPARCDGAQTPVALGRTAVSLVVICADPAGTLETARTFAYKGVRLRDGATLTASATPTGDGQFVARVDDITYTVSAKELLVESGDSVLRREPMVAYQQPRFPAEAAPSGHAAG